MDIKNSVREYWHKRSETYDKFPAPRSEKEERAVYYNLLDKILGGECLKVLDVGAGTGFISLMLAEMGHVTTGIDISEGMLEKARRKAAESGLVVTFHIGDAEKLPFDEGTFDAIISRYVLWTLPNPRQALNEWKRVIRSSGKIISIEGEWRDDSIKGKFRRICRRLGILIYERANPACFGYDEAMNRELPYRDGFTPNKARALFHECGLKEVASHELTEIRNIRARNTRLLYRIALSAPAFLIQGERT